MTLDLALLRTIVGDPYAYVALVWDVTSREGQDTPASSAVAGWAVWRESAPDALRRYPLADTEEKAVLMALDAERGSLSPAQVAALDAALATP